MRDWRNWTMGGMGLAIVIVLVIWYTGWGSSGPVTIPEAGKIAVNATGDAAKVVAQKTKEAFTGAPGSADNVPQAVASAGQSAQVPQAMPPAPMGQLPQGQSDGQEVYNPALVPVVPPPAAPPGAVPTAKKEWEVSRDMLFVQLTDQQAPRETRVRAARELSKFPTAGVSHVLETVMLNDVDPAVRFAAVQSIGLTGSAMNCAGLARSIQLDGDPQVQQGAQRSLDMINARKGMPPQSALIFQRNRNNRPSATMPPVQQDQQMPAPIPSPAPQPQEPTLAPTSPSAAFFPDGQAQVEDSGWQPAI